MFKRNSIYLTENSEKNRNHHAELCEYRPCPETIDVLELHFLEFRKIALKK